MPLHNVLKQQQKEEEERNKPKFSKKQIRDKLYYLKKTGQTNKWKRYMRQYRDYHSEDEEDQPEEENHSEEEENYSEEEKEDGYMLTEKKYKIIGDAIKTDYNPTQIQTLQSFFNTVNEDKNLLNNIMYYFKDRKTIMEKPQPPTNRPFYSLPYGL